MATGIFSTTAIQKTAQNPSIGEMLPGNRAGDPTEGLRGQVLHSSTLEASWNVA
jgi:hypothetical protein